MKIEHLNATFQPAKIGHPHGLQVTYLKDNSTRNIFVYHEDGKVGMGRGLIQWVPRPGPCLMAACQHLWGVGGCPLPYPQMMGPILSWAGAGPVGALSVFIRSTWAWGVPSG